MPRANRLARHGQTDHPGTHYRHSHPATLTSHQLPLDAANSNVDDSTTTNVGWPAYITGLPDSFTTAPSSNAVARASTVAPRPRRYSWLSGRRL